MLAPAMKPKTRVPETATMVPVLFLDDGTELASAVLVVARERKWRGGSGGQLGAISRILEEEINRSEI